VSEVVDRKGVSTARTWQPGSTEPDPGAAADPSNPPDAESLAFTEAEIAAANLTPLCIVDGSFYNDVDFKEWPERSREKAVDQVVEMAVCIANGGGGTVVFGVRDRVVGRAGALLGVPAEIEINLLLKAVYDRTDPELDTAGAASLCRRTEPEARESDR